MTKPQIRGFYAGVSGADIPIERFEFGAGIVLRKTYAHVMAVLATYLVQPHNKCFHLRADSVY